MFLFIWNNKKKTEKLKKSFNKFNNSKTGYLRQGRMSVTCQCPAAGFLFQKSVYDLFFGFLLGES